MALTVAVDNPATATARDRRAARRGLTVFALLTVLFSAPIQAAVIATGHRAWALPLMYAPGAACVLTRLLRREGFADVSFRLGGGRGWRWIGLAVACPVVVAAIAYGMAWSSGLAEFRPHGELGARVGLDDAGLPAWLRLGGALVAAVTVSTVVGLVTGALAEEVGWRGYLLPRLIDAGTRWPILIAGLAWALWHTPLIVGGRYLDGPHRPVLLGLFCVNVVLFGYVLAWLRLSSGSVWPAAVGHAVWNAVVQGVFDRATAGDHAWLWVGEQGLLLVAVNALLVAVCRPVRAH